MRPRLQVKRATGILVLAAALCACHAPSHSMATPEHFEKYRDTRELKMITPEGVRLKAREVENYPEADLAFWVDALGRHMQKRGYVLESTRCFDTQTGHRGCTLDLMLPYGAKDWVMSETIFVVGRRVVLVECAGPFSLYAQVKDRLGRALLTFDPGA